MTPTHLPTAQEALQRAQENRSRRLAEDRDRIYSHYIAMAIYAGATGYRHYAHLHPTLQQELQDSGYQVTFYEKPIDEDTPYWLISWASPAKGKQVTKEVEAPTPPEGYALATPEQLQCLPGGSLIYHEASKKWRPSGQIGELSAPFVTYACPIKPAA